MSKARFHPHDIVITPELVQALVAARHDPDAVCAAFVARHQRGDWGDIHANQSVVNDVAVTLGKGTIKSVYLLEPVGEIVLMTSLNAERGFKPKTYVMLAGQPLKP